MENSFFYFFSATAQVLGTVLALFGVFVIFKIESIQYRMLGLGETLLEKLKLVKIKKTQDSLTPQGHTFNSFKNTLQKAIARKNFDGLITNINLINHRSYQYYRRNVNNLNTLLNDLIKKTIRWATIAAILIVTALLIIPFGEFFINHKWLLYTIFFLMVCGTICIFINLISILKNSLCLPILE